jgi:hypothetical protein
MVAQAFSWNNFQKNEDQPKIDSGLATQSQLDPEIEPQKMSWGNFQNTSTYQGKPDPTADESSLGYLGRNIASNAARAAESYLGRFGNIQEVVGNVLTKYPGSMGLAGKALSEWMGPKGWETFIKGKEGSPLNPQLPTSSKLREVTESVTGEYTKPKTKNEKKLQEFTGDIAGMGRRIGNTATQQLVNNLGIPAAANAAKAAVEGLGFSEEQGTWTKLAAWTALSLANTVNAPAYAASLMNEGRNGFGPNVVANVPRYQNQVNATSRNMLQGDPRSALAQQQLAGINNDIQNGQTSMRDLMNRYDAINSAKRDRGLFSLTAGDRRAAIRNINQVRDTVRGEIQHLGASNPQALQSWQNGVQSFAVIHQSNAITNMVERHLTNPIIKSGVAGIFGAGIYKAPAVGAGIAATGAAAHKAGQVLYRVTNDPTLARYYWNAINAASRGNEGAFVKNFNDLNKSYEKKFPEKAPKNQ